MAGFLPDNWSYGAIFRHLKKNTFLNFESRKRTKVINFFFPNDDFSFKMSLLEEGLFFLKISELFKCKTSLSNALHRNYSTAVLRTYLYLIWMVSATVIYYRICLFLSSHDGLNFQLCSFSVMSLLLVTWLAATFLDVCLDQEREALLEKIHFCFAGGEQGCMKSHSIFIQNQTYFGEGETQLCITETRFTWN